MRNKLSNTLLLMLFKAFLEGRHDEIYLDEMRATLKRFSDLLSSSERTNSAYARVAHLHLWIEGAGKHDALELLVKKLERGLLGIVQTDYENERGLLRFQAPMVENQKRLERLTDNRVERPKNRGGLSFAEKQEVRTRANQAVKFYQNLITRNKRNSDD